MWVEAAALDGSRCLSDLGSVGVSDFGSQREFEGGKKVSGCGQILNHGSSVY